MDAKYNALYDMLEKHDWFYVMADSMADTRKGAREWRDIEEFVMLDPELMLLVHAFSDWARWPVNQRGERPAKPERR